MVLRYSVISALSLNAMISRIFVLTNFYFKYFWELKINIWNILQCDEYFAIYSMIKLLNIKKSMSNRFSENFLPKLITLKKFINSIYDDIKKKNKSKNQNDFSIKYFWQKLFLGCCCSLSFSVCMLSIFSHHTFICFEEILYLLA